jgi:hypothetical protein
MRAPTPAAGVVNSSSDVFSQLVLNNVQSAIVNDLEIVGTVGQCTCGSPKCDGGSPIELTQSNGSGAVFGSPDAPPMILVETRASVPALMLTEDEIREASVVTSAEYRKEGAGSDEEQQSNDDSSTSSTRHDRLVQTLSNTGNYYDTKYGAFNPFNTGL